MVNQLSILIFVTLLICGSFATALIGHNNLPFAVIFGMAWILISVVIASGLQLAAQWERGVVFRLGKFHAIKGPGLFIIIPVVDQVRTIDVRVQTQDIPAQQVITKDNVPVSINGVIFYKVKDPAAAIVEVQDFRFAIGQYSQTSLRDVIGQTTLDELLVEREQIGKAIEKTVESDTKDWGLQVSGIRIQDVNMPEELKKMMSRQASAEREKRATITKAEGDKAAANNLAAAAQIMQQSPGAMQLRTLQSIDGLGASASNTVLFAIPLSIMEGVEQFDKMLRRMNERATRQNREEKQA